jgi:hypothetical protein
MKRAVAGPSPLNKSAYADWLSTKISTKNRQEYKRLSSSAPSRDLRCSLTGDVYKMPKQDYNQLVDWLKEHHSTLSPTYTSDGKQLKRNIQTPADFIDFAFKENQQKNIETVECKGGHILSLSYNWNYKLLMVRFTNNGDVVVFFNLPANTAATLMVHGKNNDMAPPTKKGKERHMVGVEFWNLVRIRGTLHGTRYPFQYTEDFRSGNPSGRTVGIGPDGKPSKYVYKSDIELLDKRIWNQRNDFEGLGAVDDVSDKRAKLRKISEKNPARFERDVYEAFQQKEADALENDRLSRAGRVEDLADIKDYFDDDILSEDRKNPNIDRDALERAFSMYDDTANDVELAKVAHDIKDILIKAGVTYFTNI